MFFFENQEGVSLSQAAEAWSIDFASNAFSLNASPTSGTGLKTVTINAINDSGQIGMHNIDIYLKSGGSTKDTGNIRIRITSGS